MKRLAAAALPLLLAYQTLLAQDSPSESGTPTQLSGAAAAGIIGASCLIPAIMLALWLIVAIWVTMDANKRNSPNKVLVIVLAWLVWPIGLIVHLVTRPKTTGTTT